jgi:hypothetical protein
LVLITDNKYEFGAANEKMTNAGMPLSLYGQDFVSERGVSYWLTYARVLTRVSPTGTGNPASPSRIPSVTVGADGWPETIRFGLQPSDQVSLVGPATRQLFRWETGSNTGWEINRYGPLGGLTVQRDCPSVSDSCGLYTSGNPRDHLASRYSTLSALRSPLVFFSIWARRLQASGSFRVFVQNEGYEVVAEGRELASRDDGWELYGNWLNVPGGQKLRIQVTTTGGPPVLLDKAELLEIAVE